MNNVIFINYLILFLLSLLMVIGNRMSIVTIDLNSNILVLIILIVVMSIFCFTVYYIDGDVSNDNFKVVILMFLILMVLILSSYGILIFLR